jgi:hypothetical protein
MFSDPAHNRMFAQVNLSNRLKATLQRGESRREAARPSPQTGTGRYHVFPSRTERYPSLPISPKT